MVRFLRVVRPRLSLVAVLALLVAVPAAAWIAAGWAEAGARHALAERALGQMALYRANLTAGLQRHNAVPLVLAGDPAVRAVLEARRDPAAVEQLNRRLESISDGAGALAVYVLDRSGTTVAASNWEQETSFLGQNFAYRPYFREAIRGGVGHHFALGTTSGVPGYYIAFPVRDGEAARGAVVIKIGLEAVERAWAPGGGGTQADRAIVTDRHGIVFITSTPDWRFRSLALLSPDQRAMVEASQQYAGVVIRPLPITGGGVAAGELALGAPPVHYLVRSLPLPGTDWTLHVLSPLAPVYRQMLEVALSAALAAALLVLAGVFLVHRRRTLTRRREELEARVAERTAELSAAQGELIQAAKMAALGQMAAGVAHEVNNPLAAIRSYADNAVVLLERGKADSVRANLSEIAGLTERLARITRQLKVFSRKSSNALEPVNVATAVDHALALVEARRLGDGVELVWRHPAEPVWVRGEDVRLQQVLVNLFRNALDALRGAPEKRLEVRLESGGLTVRDTGAGIAPKHLGDLFEPFFTTKPAGEGLGLGLSISARIVQEFGGTLSAANHRQGGAVFTLTLNPAEPR